jgi:hypothetical protein
LCNELGIKISKCSITRAANAGPAGHYWPAWAVGMALKDFFNWLIQYKLASK